MVRRREEEESNSLSWYDRPLYDTDDEESDLFRDVEADMEAAREHHKPRRSRQPGLIGGCFSVLLTAITSIIVFAVLGVGIVLGGRALGFLPESDGSTAAMTPSGQSANVALEAANRCDPQVWWSAQQANFDAFTTLYDRVTLAPSGEPLDTLVTQMQAQRDLTLTEPDEPCLPSVREPFTQGMDNTITAVQALMASDRTGAALLARTASTALSNTLTALWDLGVATDPNTPPNLNVARSACDASQREVWYTPFRQQWEQASLMIAQMDVTASPESVRGTLAALDAIRGALIETPAPECADRARQLTIIALNSYINAVNAALQGNPDAARESASTYARSRVALNAWLLWLGVETV